MNRPSPLSVAAGIVILLAMPPLLLREMFADFGSGAATVLLNPNHVSAGAGFAGLALACGAVTVMHLVKKQPWDESGRLFALVIILGGLGGWGLNRPLVSLWAHLHGYQRCEAEDRFQAGRTSRNDVILQGWTKRSVGKSKANPGPTRCGSPRHRRARRGWHRERRCLRRLDEAGTGSGAASGGADLARLQAPGQRFAPAGRGPRFDSFDLPPRELVMRRPELVMRRPRYATRRRPALFGAERCSSNTAAPGSASARERRSTRRFSRGTAPRWRAR